MLRGLKWAFIAIWLGVVLVVFAPQPLIDLSTGVLTPVLRWVWHELPFQGEAFDPARWQQAQACALGQCRNADPLHCARAHMVHDLRERLLRPGTPMATARQLLGPGKPHHGYPACLSYHLGMCSGLRIDVDDLVVCPGQSTPDHVGTVTHIQN